MSLNLKFVFLEVSSACKLRNGLPDEKFPKELLLLFFLRYWFSYGMPYNNMFFIKLPPKLLCLAPFLEDVFL